MRASFLIAMREVRDRRAVLGAAVVAGLLPFASPLVPGVAAERAGEARDAMAVLLMLGFGLILSLLLGATAVARDLVENRLGFDFVRPVGSLGIWAGRFGAAVGLTFVSMAIVVAPAAIVSGSTRLLDRGPVSWLIPAALVAAVLLAVGLAHAGAVAFRSRSRWLVLDLAGLVVVLLLVSSGVRRIQDAFAPGTALIVAIVAVLAAIPVLWVASAVQVVRGRTDLVAGHRVQSIALWSMLAAVGLAVAGYGVWFVAADVDDLDRVWGEPAPGGPWVAIDGSATGRPGLAAQFLLDTDTGRSVRLGPGDLMSSNATMFSADGRRAVWMHRETPTSPTIAVDTIDLATPGAERRTTSIEFDLLMPVRPDLSPSGERLATLQGRNLAVHDLATGKILAATTLDGVEQTWGRMRIAFVDDDRVRVYAMRERLVEYELDVADRALTSWVGPEIGDRYPALLWGPGHERLILDPQTDDGVLLLDGRTGATIARLAPPESVPATRFGFLADGRIALVADGRTRATLDLLTPDGVGLASFDLGAAYPTTRFSLGGEAVPGSVLVSRRQAGEPPGSDTPSDLMLVDLADGAIRPVEGGGTPVAAMFWVAQPRPAAPGSVAARLVSRSGSVWLLDPGTATLRRIAGHAT